MRGLEVLRDRQRTNPRSVDAALAVIVFAAALWVPLSDPGHGGGRGHEAVLTGHGASLDALTESCGPAGRHLDAGTAGARPCLEGGS